MSEYRFNPCPNCGNNKILITKYYSKRINNNIYECECSACHKMGRPGITEKDAVILWNLFTTPYETD